MFALEIELDREDTNKVIELMRRGELGATRVFVAHMLGHTKAFLRYFAPRGKTGALQDSFVSQQVSNEKGNIWSTVHYADEVAHGSGIYAGHGPITPVQAGALKFYWDKVGVMTVWKGDLYTPEARSQFIDWALSNGMLPFLTWPKGQRATHFDQSAVGTTESRADELLDQALRDVGFE